MDKAGYDKRHEMIALPCVMVRAAKAGGSGTVVYSAEGNNGEYSTYLLTNFHVIESCIKLEDEWSTLLKAERKMDMFDMVQVFFFEYKWESRAIGGLTVQCDIVAYDKAEDLALLRSRSSRQPTAVAKLYPRNQESRLRIGMKVICVGAGLGERPVQTEGILSQFGREIDQREYWLSTAPGIYGNSGGALFLAGSYEFIGVPARIAVTFAGFSADAITHLMFAIPCTRVYDFLEAQRFRFIYDSEFTEEGEEAERKRLREEAERKMAAASS